MMTLEEAIEHYHEKAEHLRDGAKTCQSMTAAEKADCIECAEEHEQLAAWLEQLKEFQRKAENVEDHNENLIYAERWRSYQNGYRNGYHNGLEIGKGLRINNQEEKR